MLSDHHERVREYGILERLCIATLFVYATNAWIWVSDSQSVDDRSKPLGFLLVLAIFGLAALAFLKHLNWFRFPVLGFVDLLFVAILASFAFSNLLNGASLHEYVYLVTFLVFASLLLVMRPSIGLLWTDDLIRLSIAIMVASVLLALVSGLGRMEGIHAGSWRGMFEHKNRFGQFSGFVLILCFWVLRARLSIPALVGLGAAAVGLLFANSATAVGSLAISFTLIALCRLISSANLSKAFAVFVFLASVSIAAFLASEFVPQALEALGRDARLSGRDLVWAYFDVFIQQKPWFGWGFDPDAFQAEMLPQARLYLWPELSSLHSGHLEVLLRGGRVTLVLFYLFLGGLTVSSLVRFFRRRSAYGAFRLQAIFFFLSASVTESTNGLSPSAFMFLAILFLGDGDRFPFEKVEA